MKKLLSRLFRAQELGDGKATLFTRYTILEAWGRAIYVHKFHRDDGERCIHDHPWDFVSIVLRGGYWEEIQERCEIAMSGPFPIYGIRVNKHWRRPGSILWRPAETAHRITLDPDKPKPISLVFVGPKARIWGYHTAAGWVAWIKAQGVPTCE